MDIAPKTIVDIGCGQGYISSLIAENIRYIGVDASEDLINRASQIYSSPAKVFKIGDVNKLPVENNSVNAALSLWV